MAIRFTRLPEPGAPPPVTPVPPPARRSRSALWLLAVVVVLVGFAVWQWNSRWISTTGTVRAVESRLAPVGTVRVRTLRVAEGETVAAGQTLVEFHNETLERAIALAAARVRLLEEAAAGDGTTRAGQSAVDERVRDSELALAQARSQRAAGAQRLRDARRGLELARAHLAEVTRLSRSGAATRGELELALAAVERRQAEADAAALGLRVDELGAQRSGLRLATLRRAEGSDQARASKASRETGEARLAALELADLEARRLDYSLSLPHGGRVSSIHRRPGEVARTGEVILTVEDPSRVWLETHLTFAQLSTVENGTPVEIVMPDGGTAPGRLSLTWNERIAPWEEIEVGRREVRTPQQLPKAYRPVRVEFERAADAAALQSAIGRMIRLRIARS